MSHTGLEKVKRKVYINLSHLLYHIFHFYTCQNHPTQNEPEVGDFLLHHEINFTTTLSKTIQTIPAKINCISKWGAIRRKSAYLQELHVCGTKILRSWCENPKMAPLTINHFLSNRFHAWIINYARFISTTIFQGYARRKTGGLIHIAEFIFLALGSQSQA